MYVQRPIVFKGFFCSFMKCFLQVRKPSKTSWVVCWAHHVAEYGLLEKHVCFFYQIYFLFSGCFCVPLPFHYCLFCTQCSRGLDLIPASQSHKKEWCTMDSFSWESTTCKTVNPVCVSFCFFWLSPQRGQVKLRLCGCCVSVKTAFKFKIALLKFGERHGVRTHLNSIQPYRFKKKIKKYVSIYSGIVFCNNVAEQWRRMHARWPFKVSGQCTCESLKLRPCLASQPANSTARN